MSETHDRCRFYPRCEIHRGHTPPRNFSVDNYAEMRAMVKEGIPHWEIAVYFETCRQVITDILRKKRRSRRTQTGHPSATASRGRAG